MSASKTSRSSQAAGAGPDWIEQAIPVAPDRMLPARIYGRRGAAGPTPLVLHFHGGAFVSGTLESGAVIAGLLAQAGSVVVSLDYPLAPAHPFPQAAEVGHAALSWVHRNRRRLGGDGAVVLVAGEEAGGNLAAAVALMTRDRQRPPLAGQILLSPMLDPCLGTASLRAADLDVRECPWSSGWASYLPRAADAGHPYAAPGICLRLAQLPPTLVITSRDDPLRDEALAFAAKLRDAGVAVEQAVIEPPTGWPQSFMQGASREAGWAASVRGRLQRFITARQAAAAT
jgi:acetyl esterase